MRLIPLVLALFVVGCSSPTRIAKNLIRQHLERTLPDWDSYQPVEFGQLDTIYLSLQDIPEYTAAIEKSNRFRELAKLNEESAIEDDRIYRQEKDPFLKSIRKRMHDDAIAAIPRVLDSAKYYDRIREDIVLNFQRRPLLLQMKHIFRYSDSDGRKMISHCLYYFDLGLTRVENCEMKEP